MFPNGTRVFYWNAAGQTIYGTVQSSQRAADGTLILGIRTDGGTTVSLPAANVTKV
ncbi:hypothetical protein R3P38DRAFT_1435537 [Favolaschia claudopus]|uniref:Uncharacterized protein n=1 Tax=Favolaschia claudopus TaxID=2862362 RepID=A0AAW0AQC0_9AGAR